MESRLETDARADVCVIGAGITGLTTAYLLARSGRAVLVLDDGPVAGGETSRTTGHLTFVLDTRYAELETHHGPEGVRLAIASHAAAIDLIEDIVKQEGLDCDFARLEGALVVPPGESPALLERERAALERAGWTDVEWVERVSGVDFPFGPGLRFPRQAQFHAVRYVEGLAAAIRRLGGRVVTDEHAEKFEEDPLPRVGTSTKRSVVADALVIATHTPVNDRITMHTKQAASRTYVIGARVPAGAVPRILLWDTEEPYHWVRIARGEDADSELLIVGGEDHKTGQANDAKARYGRLESWARERFPMIESIEFQRSGQILETLDGLAHIGRNPGSRHTYIATGFSGNGLTYGTIAGQLLTDLIERRENAWSALYDPGRKPLHAVGRFLEETANVVAQYRDLVSGGDVDSTDEIPRGSGAIVRRGVHKIAAFRDPDGKLHERSAVCTHLGCIVRWNDGEKSWDCPCHGSRFDPDGQVLNGPAVRELPPVE